MLLTVHMSPVEMELLPLLCLCLLTVSGTTFADGNNPEVKVKEGGDVILPCSTKGSVSSQRIEWKTEGQKTVFLHEGTVWGQQDDKFIGRVSLFDDELQHGNASIKIKNTKVSDSGMYTCEISNSKKSHVKLLVGGELKDRTTENVSGAISKVSTRILDQTVAQAVLQCEVEGDFLKPRIDWKDSSGNILPATKPEVSETEGHFSIILKTTVTKTDSYSCVVTQEEIGHQKIETTYVFISVFIIIAVGACGLIVLVGVVLAILFCKRKTGGL